MFLGIYLHTAIAYMSSEVPWAIHDPARSEFFDVTVGAIHLFRMQLFFFIAGFFACMVQRRMGAWPYLKRRLSRIGIPLLVGMIVVLPPVFVAWEWGEEVAGQESVIGEFSKWPESFDEIPTGHLWFLEYLLIYYLAVYLFSRPAEKLERNGFNARADRTFARLMRSWWKPLALMSGTFWLLLAGPQVGEPESAGVTIIPTWNGLLYFGIYFLFGWFLFRQRGLLSELLRFRSVNIVLLIVGFLAYGASMEEWLRTEVTSGPVWWIGSLGAELFCWTAIFLFTGMFLRRFDKPTRWSRYAAESSYWFYIAHLPLVIALQAVFFPWNANAFVKCGTVVLISTLVLLASYDWLVRYSIVGTVMNGKRLRARKEAT